MTRSDTETSTSRPLFVASWAAVEDALTLLAATPETLRLVPETVSALRKSQAEGEPTSRLILRILSAATFIADPGVSPTFSREGGAMS